MNPLTLSRNENEQVLIESSINSIRISIKIKQADDSERILTRMFTRFMMLRAESFVILRRKPIHVRCTYECIFLYSSSSLIRDMTLVF